MPSKGSNATNKRHCPYWAFALYQHFWLCGLLIQYKIVSLYKKAVHYLAVCLFYLIFA